MAGASEIPQVAPGNSTETSTVVSGGTDPPPVYVPCDPAREAGRVAAREALERAPAGLFV
jgi:hypothetical protein